MTGIPVRSGIDGQPVESIPPHELHTKFGVVFQNDVLFADTIAANIDFGRELGQRLLKKRPPGDRQRNLSTHCRTDSPID